MLDSISRISSSIASGPSVLTRCWRLAAHRPRPTMSSQRGLERQPDDPDHETPAPARRRSEHPAPAFVRIGKGETDQVGDEDADRHRQLEERDEPAPDVRRAISLM